MRLYELKYLNMIGEYEYYYLDATDATNARSQLILLVEDLTRIVSTKRLEYPSAAAKTA